MNKSIIKITLVTIISLFTSVSFAMNCHEHKTEKLSLTSNQSIEEENEKIDKKVSVVNDNSVKVYVCPMHSNEISETPSNCSICGMPLEETFLTEE